VAGHLAPACVLLQLSTMGHSAFAADPFDDDACLYYACWFTLGTTTRSGTEHFVPAAASPAETCSVVLNTVSCGQCGHACLSGGQELCQPYRWLLQPSH
jgi:hypothetical protein